MVEEVLIIRTPDSKVTGAALKTANCVVQVEIEADEVSIDVA
jgi:hypothetical protein